MSPLSIGNKISRERQNKNMTQKELAGRVGVTPQAISKWERDQSIPDAVLLAELCRVLEISADDLLGVEIRNVTENGDSKSQNEIWNNLRNCLEPLELIFGKELVTAFMDNSYQEKIVEVRKRLSKEGILMPLVRVRDVLSLEEKEFVILSYQKVLYRGEFDGAEENICQHIMMHLEKTVREKYADILSPDIVKELVDNLQIKYPALVHETVPERISYGLLTDILKRFVAGGNSCRYFSKVIEITENILRQKPAATVEEIVAVLERELRIDETVFWNY
ncbi:MAG: FHIPEP family type III secretion protein [Lachnospiraceae bacterium]|nr:FHIPEP family type III secretion protein [Lachnospiraceae bacterium]